MHLLALGLNHRTAPVKIRERAAFSPERLASALQEIVARDAVSEAAILSTCNRTEIYCRQDEVDPERVVDWLCRFHDLGTEDIRPYVYHHPDQSAVKHAFRVASGLDSMVLGEPQILGQMKDAFATAHKSGATGKILNRLFQQTFTVAKHVRTHTAIGASAVSVAYAAVDLAKQIFTSLSDQTVLLIGAGDTIELSARHLHDNRVKHMIVANRTVERARRLADPFSAEAISLEELPSRLHEADILIASTASTLPILGKGAVERALKKRKHKPVFMVDLAVPRDIEEEVGELNDVYLYTVDNLEGVIQENLESRKEAAEEAEKMIELQVSQFMHWLQSLDAVPTILALRSTVDDISQIELDKARRRLARGDNPDEVMTQLARALSNKFTHAPMDALRQADHEGNPGLLAAARKLFNLKDD